jgi:hypothetical protein
MGRMKGEDEIESEGGETVRCVSCILKLQYNIIFHEKVTLLST